MTKLYARIDEDISPRALVQLQRAIERHLDQEAAAQEPMDGATRQELLNLANGFRAQVQHIESGMDQEIEAPAKRRKRGG